MVTIATYSAIVITNCYFHLKPVNKLRLCVILFLLRFFLRKKRKNEQTGSRRHKLAHPRHKYCSRNFFMAIFVFSTKKPMGIAANMNEKSKNVVLLGSLLISSTNNLVDHFSSNLRLFYSGIFQR